MNDFRLFDVEALYWLWSLPALAVLYWRASVKRREAIERFAAAPVLGRLQPAVSKIRRFGKAAMVVGGMALLIAALARPAWNRTPREITRRGRDVVFLLDVSRSMLAEDLRPNRLERAKLAILDAVGRLEGDRVALVAFAGLASVKCPLTQDYGFFRMALEDVSTDSAARGGTLIGDAIRKTLQEIFDDKRSQYRDVILITDGEDHESFPIEAAKEAGAREVRLIVIGLGDENVGRRIPVTTNSGEASFLKYKGQEIWSRLDADALRKMAAATPGGRYLNVATGAIDLGEIYSQLVASAERRDIETSTIDRYEEKFQIFLALSFLLLCVELVVSDRRHEATQ